MKIALITLLLIFYSTYGFSQCWIAIENGHGFSLAIKTDSTLWAWGENSRMQLGDSSFIDKNIPTQIGISTDWKLVSASYYGSFAIKNNGTLWVWGQPNTLSGDPYIPVPTQIGSDTDWKEVSAGSRHCLFLKSNGTLWAMGNNSDGQLGDGTNTRSDVPEQIGTDSTWTAISGGEIHSMALKANGTLWTWGSDIYGQLGNSTTTSIYIPTQIDSSINWQFISSGNRHSMALKTNGTLWIWGSNYQGELGTGVPHFDEYTPIQLTNDSDWVYVDGGQSCSTAIKANGTFWAWGDNVSGQLGNGTNTESDIPIQIGTDTDWNTVVAGYYSTLGIKTNQTLVSFGNNLYGQVGDGTNTDKTTPTIIGCNVISVKELNDKNTFLLFPNPAITFISIIPKDNLFQNSTIEIKNYLGQTVLSVIFKEQVDISKLSDGIYTIQIRSHDNKILNGKFIKN